MQVDSVWTSPWWKRTAGQASWHLELGCSISRCGGEELSRRIGKREAGDAGTQYKMRLGTLVEEGHLDVEHVQEYKRETHLLYDIPQLQSVFEQLGERWREERQCVALVTGGGSCNRFFVELVQEMAKREGLDLWPLAASDVNDIIEMIDGFSAASAAAEVDGFPARARIVD